MAKITQDQVLLAIADLGVSPGGLDVYQLLCDRLGPAWRIRFVYPSLIKLEEAGLLASEWAQEPPPRRRLYHVTETGQRRVEALQIERLSRLVDEVASIAQRVVSVA